MLDPESETLKGMLIDAEICSEEQLIEIEEEHERTGKVFQELLVSYEIIGEDELMGLIAQNLGTDIVDLTGLEIDKEIIDMIDPSTIRMYGVIPLKEEDGILTVASANPLNYQIPEELHFILGKDVQIVIANEGQIDAAIEKYYPVETGSMHDMLESMDLEITDDSDIEGVDASSLEDVASSTPIVRFVDVIMYQAIKAEASDIHFEPFEKEFRIRYRVDGVLYEMSPPPMNLSTPVISRVKIMSGLNISERRRPQDGRISLKIAGRPVDLRVSCLPTAHGESVVLRVLDRSVINLDLEVLGIGQEVLKAIRDVIHMPNGIFVVTGPTGSGKTTTLYSCLKEVNNIEDKILTAEDPVEYDLEGIIQLPINDAIGMTFQRALRAFLRQDPDRIMLGEIRDIETARMAIQASLTGHFVFSTLHTNDSAGTITRLIDMGVEPFLINSSLVGVLGQRLIRRVCPNCKTGFDPTDEDLAQLEIDREEAGDRKFYYGKGCETCNQTGYKGRKALSELLLINNDIRDLIMKKSPTLLLKEKARSHGMETMREDGIRAILNGETTMEEVLKYTSK
jgi:type IV pilus assembly protein PilB